MWPPERGLPGHPLTLSARLVVMSRHATRAVVAVLVVTVSGACAAPVERSASSPAIESPIAAAPTVADPARAPTVVAEATPPIASPARASAKAARGIAREVGASCDLDLVRALAARHPGVRQFVTVVTDSWSATTARLGIAALDGSTWVCQLGTRTAMVGAKGTRPLVQRRSGDDTAPAGVFPLGTQTAWDGQQFQFFGNSPDPGVRGTYRAVQPEDCWGATPGSPTYQQLYRRANCPGPDDEWLPRIGDVYSYAAVIGANLDPVSGDAPGEPPYAAAIFLHRHNYGGGSTPKPTSGCVSLAAPDLVTALTMLDPALGPAFAIGERAWLMTSA